MTVKRALLAVLLLSAAPASAFAECHTVGPGGTHATIQAAVDAAMAPGGLDCIRVASGYRLERVDIPDRLAGRTLAISGGWRDAFLRQTGETTVDGGGSAPVVRVFIRSGRLSLVRFKITGGHRPTLGSAAGGGLRLTVYGSASLLVEDCEVRDNRLESDSAEGGGLWADLGGTATLRIVRTSFIGNAARATTGQAFGGGASITASVSSRAEVLSSDFLGNVVSGPEFTQAAALDIAALGSAFVEVSDNEFLRNRALSATADAWGVVNLLAGRISPPDAAQLVARRNRIQNNAVQRVRGHQVELRAGDGDVLSLTDTLVSDGNGTGILTWPTGTGTVYLTNLTVTKQAARGLDVVGSEGSAFLSNSILFGNGTDLVGAVSSRSNRIGLDPGFLDAASGNYHLAPGSPAIDAGTNRPPGGLGPLDLDRGPRVQGWSVDQGAYETAAGPGEGGTCHVRELDIPAPSHTAACRCLSDDSLREFHCGFFLPDVFVGVRFPFAPPPGQPVPVEWTIQPFASVGNGAYSLRSEARLGGQWVPQSWLGPTAPHLKLGQVVVEPFQLSLPPGGPTPLRTTLTYPRSGGQAARVALELLLPDLTPAPNAPDDGRARLNHPRPPARSLRAGVDLRAAEARGRVGHREVDAQLLLALGVESGGAAAADVLLVSHVEAVAHRERRIDDAHLCLGGGGAGAQEHLRRCGRNVDRAAV